MPRAESKRNKIFYAFCILTLIFGSLSAFYLLVMPGSFYSVIWSNVSLANHYEFSTCQW